MLADAKVYTFSKFANKLSKKNVQKKHVRLFDKTRTCFLKKTYVFFFKKLITIEEIVSNKVLHIY
ncbi:hypothetical protein DW727_01180 [Parabacteroides sp. AM27-42]|nr:hypothetical protein DW727_01180 [Parabacteroides sp. AM27-42]